MKVPQVHECGLYILSHTYVQFRFGLCLIAIKDLHKYPGEAARWTITC